MWYQPYLVAALEDLMGLQPAGWTCSISEKHGAGTSSGEPLSSDLLPAETKTQLLLHLSDMLSQTKTGGLHEKCPS